MPLRHAHGSAQLINSLDADHNELFGVQYTTCPLGHTDWMFTAPDMTLDNDTNTGEAHDVTIDFLGVPIFWTPYLNFPIKDERKSGLIGGGFSFDVVGGFTFDAPYYLNLADNFDDTIYPSIITKRGLQVGDEFRYLGDYNTDSIYASYLPHDQVAGGERSELVVKHNTEFNIFTNFNLIYNWVSDDAYFQDLGSNLPISSEVFLERHARLTYDDEQDWSFITQIQDFQVIDPFVASGQFPYRRLPQMVLNWGNNLDTTGPLYGVYAEGVRFQRDERIGTWRSDIKPFIGYPFTDASGYFTPTLAWRLTDYDLGQSMFTAAGGVPVTDGDRHLSRVTPIFDIDTGLYFDRDAGDYIETLEPRLYYLRIPYRDQNQIPIFDTVSPQFSYEQMFSDNRFIGADRQGDANQLSYGISSRFLDATTGGQLLQWDLSQIRYFADRRVQISPLTPPDTELFSDVSGDVLYNLNDQWNTTYQQLWNPATHETDLASVILQYHPAYHQVVNIGYQFRRSPVTPSFDIKQTDFSFDWPLSRAWNMVGRWNYDIADHIPLESSEE